MTDPRPTLDEILGEARVVESRPEFGLTFARFDGDVIRVFSSETGLELGVLSDDRNAFGLTAFDDSDIDPDDYSGECDECDARFIPSHSDDHCAECGNCFAHCLGTEGCEGDEETV